MPYFGRRGRQRRSNFFRKNVNLPLYKLPVVCYTISRSWGISAAGSAQHWQCWGQRFESAMLHQNKSESVRRFGFFAFSRMRISKKREAWGATLPAQGMGEAGGGYGPSLDRGLLLHPCAGAEGFAPAGATKGLSDRPLEAFGHHTWLELLQAKMPGGSSLASQLEEISFFQQVKGGTPALRGANWLWVGRQRLPMGRAPWTHTMRLYPWGESSRKGWERIS